MLVLGLEIWVSLPYKKHYMITSKIQTSATNPHYPNFRIVFLTVELWKKLWPVFLHLEKKLLTIFYGKKTKMYDYLWACLSLFNRTNWNSNLPKKVTGNFAS